MMIHNTGGTRTRGNYGVETYRGRDKETLDQAQKTRTARRMGAVLNHQRLYLHVWHLVAKALKACEYGDH